jgi:hypothetical protein
VALFFHSQKLCYGEFFVIVLDQRFSAFLGEVCIFE